MSGLACNVPKFVFCMGAAVGRVFFFCQKWMRSVVSYQVRFIFCRGVAVGRTFFVRLLVRFPSLFSVWSRLWARFKIAI